ncbi:MAG: hypothetical protein ACRC17_11635 [Culicoidibacterales bacterium]
MRLKANFIMFGATLLASFLVFTIIASGFIGSSPYQYSGQLFFSGEMNMIIIIGAIITALVTTSARHLHVQQQQILMHLSQSETE